MDALLIILCLIVGLLVFKLIDYWHRRWAWLNAQRVAANYVARRKVTALNPFVLRHERAWCISPMTHINMRGASFLAPVNWPRWVWWQCACEDRCRNV